MGYADVSKIKVVDNEHANLYLEKGWVVVSATYVPGVEKEVGYFSILLGWPRSNGAPKEH